MLRLTLRNALAHKARLALTTLAVVLGVGFVVGSFVVTDSLRGSVDQLFDDVTGGVDVSVRAATELGMNDNSLSTGARGRIPAGLVDDIRAIDGVAAAEQQVGGYAQLLDRDGEPLTTTGAPFLGVSWGHEAALVPATIDVGRPPDGMGEIAVDRGTAKDYGFDLGDRTSVLLADGSDPEVEIVGIFTFGEANNLLGARLTAFDVDVATEIFGTDGMVDSIDVAAAPGVAPATLAERLQDALPDGVESVTGTQVADENKDAIDGLMSTFQNVLLGFAAIALFVSAFLINNTFAIIVGQRIRELALLRSLGALPAQVRRSVLGEASAIGAIASAIGVGFGMLLAVAMQAILASGGFDLPTQELVLAPRTVLAGVVVGLGVTVAAAVAPARHGATVAPIEGMRSGYTLRRWSRTGRAIVGGVGAAAGAVAVTAAVLVAEDTLTIIGLLGAGVVLVCLGVAQLSPVVAVPLADTLGRPVAGLFRVAGRLAHADAVRNPDRTAKTAAALMIGLAMVTTVFVVGESMKRTFADSIDDAVAADFVVSTSGFVGFSPAITHELASLPELDAVTGVRFNRFVIDGNERDLVAADATAAGDVIDIDLRAGSFADLDEHAIFLHEDPATDLGVGVGDTVEVVMASSGPLELTVAGVYADATYAGNYLVDLGLFERHYPVSDLDLHAFASIADGLDPAVARDAVEEALADQPQVTLQDRAEFKAAQQAQFDSLLVAVNGLLGLALLIALLGIANTLALSVLERTREIGLLRAVGMLRRQVRQMIVAESVMVSVFGAALGVALGVGFGLAATAVLPETFVTTTAVPYTTVGAIVLIASLCGVVAGLLPARRAAHLDVLRAVATE